jgi:lipoprotein-anchoring transpeptidase ErfK/SrfK
MLRNLRALCAIGFVSLAVLVEAQQTRQVVPALRPASSPTRSGFPAAQPVQPMRKANDLIRRQEPLKINQSVLKQATPDSVHVVVSLTKQRAYLMVGEQVAADSPISSGKRGHGTPSGHFSVLEKDPNHRSSIYGDYVDGRGRTVRAGVSARIDSAPSGTHFVGAPMTWFMRLTGDGVGMHIGILPGYPASHGCVRMSSDGAKFFYDHVKVGTPVAVGDY